MSLKLYTKTGDKGTTSLLGGKKVSKADLRIEAYGNVDELNSFIGCLKDQETVTDKLKKQLHLIQKHLFTIGSLLAAEAGFSGFDLPRLSTSEVDQLETWIDEFDSGMPALKNFVLPGGHSAASWSHVCRSVCRRAERSIVSLSRKEEIDEIIIQFMNRLSDYLFIFARHLGHSHNVPEITWNAD